MDHFQCPEFIYLLFCVQWFSIRQVELLMGFRRFIRDSDFRVSSCKEGVTSMQEALSWVQFSYSAVSNSLQPHGLQHARLPRPSPAPGTCSNSCPLSQWCHPTISSSVVPFSSCLQSYPESGSFPMIQFFASGGQIVICYYNHCYYKIKIIVITKLLYKNCYYNHT